MKYKLKLFCLAMLACSGCISPFRSHLSDYDGMPIRSGEPGFETVVGFLKNSNPSAAEYLKQHAPVIVMVDLDHVYWGNCVYVVSTWYKGRMFAESGKELPLVIEELSPYDKPSEVKFKYEAKRYLEKKQKEDEAEEYRREEKLISSKKQISFEELIGIKSGSKLSERYSKIGIWPEAIFKNASYPYDKRAVPELKAIPGMSVCGVRVDKDSGVFSSVVMGRRDFHGSQGNDYINKVIHTIKASLRTDLDPECTGFGKARRWKWINIALKDNCYVDVELDVSKCEPYGWGADVTITDCTERHKKTKDCSRLQLNESQFKRNSYLGPQNSETALFEKVREGLCVVSTSSGSGSGFVMKDGDRCYFYTNEHVIRCCSKLPIVKTIEGKDIRLGTFWMAEGTDLVRFEVSSDIFGLEPLTNSLELGGEIVVFGNSDGADVVTSVAGKVIGIGPDLIEVNAEFIQGNSGSPVLTSDGKVAGVATFAINAKNKENWVKRGTRFDDVRRFAIRIDNIEWRLVDWEMYVTISNR